MTTKQYWFSGIVQSLRLTSSPYEVSAKTGSIITSIESALTTRKSDVLSTLLSLDAPPSLLDQFHQAKNEVSSPFSLPTNTIFPETIFPLSLDIRTQSTEVNISFNNKEQLSELHQMLSRDGCNRRDFSSTSECATQLIDQGLLSPVDPSSKDNCLFEEPGIYRLQHACLLFKSSTSTVIVDPQFSYELKTSWLSPHMLPDIDAVVISHSHEDHFCPASLMFFPPNTPIIIPNVKKPSMLCVDMAAILKSCGFTNIIEANWYSSHVVGDITLHTYPFYGEQPWLNFYSPVPGFRNQGNTFVVDFDDTKIWFLIDSGQEYGFDMRDLASRVRSERGHIDIVLSNLREFHWRPRLIDGTGRFLFCFPTSILADPSLWPQGQLTTFGCQGMRHFLDELQPSYFLPYAHWWQPLANTPEFSEVDLKATEEVMLKKIEKKNGGSLNLKTELYQWLVGDRFTCDGGTLRVHAIADIQH